MLEKLYYFLFMDSIIHWNINGLRTHIEALRKYSEEIQPTAFCLNETRLQGQDPPTLQGYTPATRNDRLHLTGGGVAIYVRDDIRYVEIPCVRGSDMCAIEIKVNNAKVAIICAYWSPINSNTTFNLNNINAITSKYKQYLILGDFNAHHPLWGSNSINSRGRLLEAEINKNNWCLLNEHSEATYWHPRRNYSAVLDLAIASTNLMRNINRCEPGDFMGNYKAYHLLLIVGFTHNSKVTKNNSINKYNIKNATANSSNKQ